MPNDSELERFCASFANEFALRKAVIALLEQQLNVLWVRDTSGAGEIGKDIAPAPGNPYPPPRRVSQPWAVM